jgi:hypothetical protein
MYPMGAGIRTSLGTRAASAKLSPSSFPILFAQNLFLSLLRHSDWASLEQRLFSRACPLCACLPTQLSARETQSRLIVDSYQPLSLHPRFTAAHCPARPAVCNARTYSSSRVTLLPMAAPSRCISPPHITLPHAAHGADSSRRGGQPYSPRFTCCQSVPRLCLRLLSRQPSIPHPFSSTAARFTSSRLICHPPFT